MGGINMGCVARLTMSRASLGGVGCLALVSCQIVSATVHCCYTADNKDNGEQTEDQDVEHGPLDHEPLDWIAAISRPSPSRCPTYRWSGARRREALSLEGAVVFEDMRELPTVPRAQ